MANDFSNEDACEALWNQESGALGTDSKLDNDLTVGGGMAASTSDYKQGSASGEYDDGTGAYMYCTDASLSSEFPMKNGDTTKKITVCGWFKHEAENSNDGLICKDESDKRCFRIRIDADNDLECNIGYDGGVSFEEQKFGGGSYPISQNIWYWFAWTYDDSDKSFRIMCWDDNANDWLNTDETGNYTNNINVEDSGLAVGAYHGGGNKWVGHEDEFVVFNDVLTVSQLTAIKNGTFPPEYDETATDGADMGDSATATLTIPPAATDGADIGDSASTQVEMPPVVSDGLDLGDTATAEVTKEEAATDGLNLGDTASIEITFNPLALDGLSMGDTPDTQAEFGVPATDGTQLSDTAQAQLEAILEAVDGVAMGDLAGAGLLYEEAATDGISLSDSASLTSERHLALIAEKNDTLFRPMKVTVTDVDGNTGSYSHADWTSDMGELILENTLGVTDSNADCTFIATALVERAESEAVTGSVRGRMNCLLEIFDKVQVHDGRSAADTTDWAGGLFGVYDKLKGQYYMDVRLGGIDDDLATYPGGITYGTEMPFDLQEFIDSIPVGSLDGATITDGTIGPWALQQAMIPYTHTVEPDPDNGSYDWNTVVWTAGTIHFANGASQTINSGSRTPTDNDPEYLYFIIGDATLHATDDFSTATGHDRDVIAVIQRSEGSESSDKASWDSHRGKHSILNARAIIANMILAGHIAAGAIETDHLAANAVTASTMMMNTLDNVLDNPGAETHDTSGWSGDGTVTTSSRSGSHAFYCACGDSLITDYYFPVREGDNWVFSGYTDFGSTPPNGDAYLDILRYNSAQAYLGVTSTTISDGSDPNYNTEHIVHLQIPAGTSYVRFRMRTAGSSGGWRFDDLWANKANQITVMGTPGGQRIEIVGSGVIGYSGAATKAFELESDTGLIISYDQGIRWYSGATYCGTIRTSTTPATNMKLHSVGDLEIETDAQSIRIDTGDSSAAANIDIETFNGDFNVQTIGSMNFTSVGSGRDFNVTVSDDIDLDAGTGDGNWFTADAGEIQIESHNAKIKLQAQTDLDLVAETDDVNITGNDYVIITATNQDVQIVAADDIELDAGAVYCDSIFVPGTVGQADHKVHDLGSTSRAWDDAYADDWHNVADFYHLDGYDDLAAILQISGSGVIDERTGLELIDDNTIPDWLLSRSKDGKEILYDPEGKPYLSLKTTTSLLMGAIRQLTTRVEGLEGR